MSELLSIWKNSDLTGATLPPPFSIPNNPSARSIQINNQSRYWLILSKKQTGQDVLRMEPFSYQTMPTVPDLQLRIDTSLTNKASSLSSDNEFVDYSSIEGVISYQKGSTQFSGAQTVDVSSAQITMTASNVAVNNGGSGPLTDASGNIVTANSSQTVLPVNNNRKYLLFQNLSDTDMYVNFGATATIGSGSIWIGPAGGSIEFGGGFGFCPSNDLNVICYAAGKSFTCKYM